MEKLNKYIKHYFRTIYYTKSDAFSLTMLHSDFVEIVKECSSLEKYLVEIFDTYKRLSNDEQKYIYKGVKRNNFIEKLCGSLVEPVHYEDIPGSIRKLLKKFFYYLYDDLIGTVAYETACCSFHDYHQDFLKENESVAFCPFCGLFPLTNQGVKYRDDYDHFFPRSIYIFNSVNIKNLIPMCNICNSKVKRDKDIIYRGNNRSNRRKVYYPYRNNSDNVKIGDVKVTMDFDNTGHIEIQLHYPLELSEEMEAWIDIFDIINRYKGVMSGSCKRWNERFRKKYKRSICKESSLNFSDFVKDELLCIEDRGFEERSFLEKAYLEYITQLDSFESDLKETVGM